jgi:hypothetical protein
MRGLIVILFAAVAFSSCQKSEVNPTAASATSTTASATTAANQAVAATDTNVILHTVTLTAKNQLAKTLVTDSTLNISYAQDVAILICAKGYNSSYSTYLVADFSGSILSKFNYYSSSKTGVTTYNYIENNLNDVDFKTVTDTTVNNTAMKKVRVQRTISFTKRFATPALAASAQKIVMAQTADPVKYISYMYYDKTYPETSASTKVSYY